MRIHGLTIVIAGLVLFAPACSEDGPGTEWFGPYPDGLASREDVRGRTAVDSADSSDLLLVDSEIPEDRVSLAETNAELLPLTDVVGEAGADDSVSTQDSSSDQPATLEVAGDYSNWDDEEGQDLGPVCIEPHPILFVHGINGSSANYDVMIQRFADSGWPADLLFVFDAKDPKWGCNVDNAAAIAALVESILAQTGNTRIDLVAHSMGTISTRYYLKFLEGHQFVNTYVTLGGMNHGLFSPCLAPDFLGVCVWQEICQWGAFVAQLNEDPATPGALHWVSMYGTADTVIPNSSSELEGAENIAFDGVEHSGPDGLLEVPEVYDEVLRVLDYPCW